MIAAARFPLRSDPGTGAHHLLALRDWVDDLGRADTL